MLVPIRAQLENLSAKDACDAALKDNLFGLDIDPRVVEIAAFALALTAWRYPEAGGYRKLPEMHIACSGLPITSTKEDWLKLARRAADEIVQSKDASMFPDPNKDTIWHNRLISGMEQLYELFKQAPVLGSLINPRQIRSDMFSADFDQLSGLLDDALSRERGLRNEDYREIAVTAQGLANAANVLGDKYHLVITNVPYLGRRNQVDSIKKYCELYYPNSKNDLANVFLERCLEYCEPGGNVSSVLPQNWLFLTSYKKLRESLLKNETWNLVARLGPKGFQTPMWDFNVQLLSLNRKLARPGQLLRGLDVSELKTANEKAQQILEKTIREVEQVKQLENPDSRILLEPRSSEKILGDYADSGMGLSSYDRPRFILKIWEIVRYEEDWLPMQSRPIKGELYSGMEEILKWENGKGDFYALVKDKEKYEGYKSGIWKAGSQFWGKKGFALGVMSDLPSSIYIGIPYDVNVGVIIPKKSDYISAIWAFIASGELNKEVRKLDQKLMVTNATFLKVQFDIEHWENIANESYIKSLPDPISKDPKQCIFHGHPVNSLYPIQVSVARLLGYQWLAERQVNGEGSETNGYQLELSEESIELAKQCQALLPFADEDGIVCIPAVRGEAPAADRLLKLLAAAYGPEWSGSKLAELLNNVDHAGKTLETWLRDKFFVQHCKLFHHRPFIWHIWDGLNDGFAALVNYHKLNYKNLETLIYTYLGDWINRQKDERAQGMDGAEERLVAAENLKKKLELILKGEEPYDIFVRWKSITEQPIGWNPDLNDGVRLNIRPFMSVPDVRKKGAGVLRDKPNIHWKKDRGKDVQSAPWYNLGPQYGGNPGDRINDHHLSLEEKRKARENH